MLVLGKYESPEARERLKRLRASIAPAPRPAPSFAPGMGMGMGPGGSGGRSDVSPSEGSALMVDNYGRLLPPKIDFDSYKESLSEPPEIDLGPRDEPDYSGFEGDPELTDDEVYEAATRAVEDFVHGGPADVSDYTELSDVDRARVQDSVNAQLQDGIIQDHEALAGYLVDNGISNPAALVDHLRTGGEDFGLQVGDKVYHLEGDNALVETQPDRTQVVYNAQFVQERAVEIVEAREHSKEQEASSPSPSLGQDSKVDDAGRHQITRGFRDQVAERIATSREAKPQSDTPKLSPSQEAAHRIDAQRKTFPVDTQATPEVMPTREKPSSEQNKEPKAAPSRQQESSQNDKVQKDLPAPEAQAKALSPSQAAAQRVEAGRNERVQQQASGVQQTRTVVDLLRAAGPGKRAVDKRNGNAFHLEGKELVRKDKNGVETGRMDADKAKQIVLDRLGKDKQGPVTKAEPSKPSAKSPEPNAQQQSSKEAQQKSGQNGFARAAQQQSGGQSHTAEAAARAEKTQQENAARRAAMEDAQKNQGKSL